MEDRDRMNPPSPPPPPGPWDPAPPPSTPPPPPRGPWDPSPGGGSQPIGPPQPGAVAVVPGGPAHPPLAGPVERPQATWRWWEAVLLFLIAVVVQAAVLLVAGEDFVDSTTGELVAGLVFGVVIGAGTVMWLRVWHRPAFAAIGPPKRPVREVGSGLGWGLVIRLGSFPVILLVATLVEAFIDRSLVTPEQLETDVGTGTIALAVLVAVVVAPVAEELFFRGFLYRSLRVRHGYWLAGLVSSFLFGLVHWQPEGLLASLPLMAGVAAAAMSWAYLYDRTGSILVPIASHMAFNLVGVVLILTTS
jgi:membrane protease YdiL (CAAX protease family)